jgi:hypothetical protein
MRFRRDGRERPGLPFALRLFTLSHRRPIFRRKIMDPNGEESVKAEARRVV